MCTSVDTLILVGALVLVWGRKWKGAHLPQIRRQSCSCCPGRRTRCRSRRNCCPRRRSRRHSHRCTPCRHRGSCTSCHTCSHTRCHSHCHTPLELQSRFGSFQCSRDEGKAGKQAKVSYRASVMCKSRLDAICSGASESGVMLTYACAHLSAIRAAVAASIASCAI